jgi:two-component system, sensor histidine kinase and response regulator
VESAPPPPQRPRVLVVDDEQMNLDTFRRVFRKEFEMALVASAADALRELGKGSFDVVVTDYAMPGMNGIELLAKARQMHPDVGRMIITAHADLQDVQSAKTAGLSATVLMKPWKAEDVLKWVGHLHRIRSMRSAVSDLHNAMTTKPDGED